MMAEPFHPGEAYRTALLVIHVHERTRCLNCSPDGCPALCWAVEYAARESAARIRARAVLLVGTRMPPGVTAASLRTTADSPTQGGEQCER